jgi:FkbH-like protein
LLARDDAIVLAFRLADRFGDHGLVSTLIALHEGDALRIDSWLMSCRVFARSAEAFILRGLVAMARERGAARLLGEYRPTPKNAVVAGLFPSLGFAASASGEGIFMREVAAGVEDLVTHIG